MFALSRRSVRGQWVLFAGSFVAVALGVALLGVIATALIGTVGAAPKVTGPSVTVTDSAGAAQTFVRDAPDLGGLTAALAFTAAVSAFIVVVVVAGTFASSVAQRRRDLGLLRLLGASGAQIRRMVLGEAVAVAAPAAAVGCALAAATTSPALSALGRTALAPVPLRPPDRAGPLLIAGALGVGLAVLAALVASRRGSRVRPVEALREADLDTGVLTGGRLLTGGLMLAAGGVLTVLAPRSGAEAATPLSLFGPWALTAAATALGPAYLPPLARLLGAPLRHLGGVSGRLAVAAVATSRRRTASVAAPALAIVAVVGIAGSVLATTAAAATADEQARARGQLVATPVAGPGLDEHTVARLAAAPGVGAVSAPAPVAVIVVAGPGASRVTAAAVDLPALVALRRMRVVLGDVAPLTGTDLAVNAEYAGWNGLHAGSAVRLAFYDGRVVDATVRTILDGGTTLPQVLLPPALAGDQAAPAPQAAILLDRSRADPATAAADLAAAAGPGLVLASPAEQAASASTDEQDRANRLVLLLLAGPASIFALIAIANTTVMTFSRRGPDIAALRLLGTRPGQIRAMVVFEAILTSAVATAIAAGLVALAMIVYPAGLRSTYLAAPVSVPVPAMLTLAAACLTVATTTGVLAAGRLLTRPVPGTAAA